MIRNRRKEVCFAETDLRMAFDRTQSAIVGTRCKSWMCCVDAQLLCSCDYRGGVEGMLREVG